MIEGSGGRGACLPFGRDKNGVFNPNWGKREDFFDEPMVKVINSDSKFFEKIFKYLSNLGFRDSVILRNLRVPSTDEVISFFIKNHEPDLNLNSSVVKYRLKFDLVKTDFVIAEDNLEPQSKKFKFKSSTAGLRLNYNIDKDGVVLPYSVKRGYSSDFKLLLERNIYVLPKKGPVCLTSITINKFGSHELQCPCLRCDSVTKYNNNMILLFDKEYENSCKVYLDFIRNSEIVYKDYVANSSLASTSEPRRL